MRQEQSPDRYCNKNGERVREGRKGYETSAVRRKKYLWSMDSGNWNGVHTLPGQNGSTAGGGNCLWSFLSPNLNSALREKRRKGENWIGKLPVELGEEQNGGDWRESNRERKRRKREMSSDPGSETERRSPHEWGLGSKNRASFTDNKFKFCSAISSDTHYTQRCNDDYDNNSNT